jgi:hypothetical protein
MSEQEKAIRGKIILICDAQTFPSGFTKREFVIETDEKYPQKIKFELVKDKCAKLDQCHVGQTVEVSYNIRGNEHNGKYYVSLQAWKIANVGPPMESEPPAPGAAMPDEEAPF